MTKRPRHLVAEALAKCATGVRGLDQITDGGLPPNRSTLVCGGPGAGKVPTLVKRLPAPLRRLIGDLSDEDRVMVGLDIVPKSRNGRR